MQQRWPQVKSQLAAVGDGEADNTVFDDSPDKEAKTMIGWWIVVAAQTPEERDRAIDTKPAVLANWEVGPGGIDWLSQLVKAGKANQLSFNGYPNRFTALADDVLPLFVGGPPAHQGPAIIGDDYVMPANWKGNVIFHQDKIAACPSDQLLTIDAWDQS